MTGEPVAPKWELVYTAQGHTYVADFGADKPEPYQVDGNHTEWRTPDKQVRLSNALVVATELRQR
jgi:hypothetical protein